MFIRLFALVTAKRPLEVVCLLMEGKVGLQNKRFSTQFAGVLLFSLGAVSVLDMPFDLGDAVGLEVAMGTFGGHGTKDPLGAVV